MHEEAEAHLFIHCTISSSIWHLTKCNVNLSSDLNFESWLKLNYKDDTTSHLGIPHNCLFIYTLWHLWIARNDCTFNSKTPSPKIIAKKAISSAAELFYIATNTTLGPPNLPITMSVKWNPPQCEIIRDHNCNWISGFSAFVGQGSTLKAELWAISVGINLASSLNCTHLWVKTDSLVAFNLLRNSSVSNMHDYYNLISYCRLAFRSFSSFQVSHYFREGNTCADNLAKHGLLTRCSFTTHHRLPPFPKTHFLADSMGVAFERSITRCLFPDLICNDYCNNRELRR
ncbi:putative ribonuclease h protein [Senna tora]|uniref:Putative ribonuclease h protein n=1 Tax=Senna tora TaxID=362788 RepID=A0A834WKT6_9FABA|nr:putative ribonuclease h protein [Senna tora]